MLIVIPTYKRLNALSLVLRSLCLNSTERINEKIRVLVVNNYPPFGEAVAQIVKPFRSDERFSWEILHRYETLPPVKNWYSAICDYSSDGEIVMINSDDDLLLPWTLEYKFNAMNSSLATMSLSMGGPNIWYGERDLIYFQGVIPQGRTLNDEYEWLDPKSFLKYQPQHLSNHCYRMGTRFRMALEKAQNWFEVENWLEYNHRSLYITLYLPLAMFQLSDSVIGLPRLSSLGGREVAEIKNAKYGIPGWNHGFIHLVGWSVLSNPELQKIGALDDLRLEYKHEFIKWLPTYLVDERVGWKKLRNGLISTKFPLMELVDLRVLQGIRFLLKDVFRFTGRKIEKMLAKNGVGAELFFQQLEELKSTHKNN